MLPGTAVAGLVPGCLGQEGSCGVKNLAALRASNRPQPSRTCYSCPDRGLVMANTSLRDTEPDRALVYMFPGSAPSLLCGASWESAPGSICSSTSSSSLQRPTPVSSSFKGQPLLSLLLPLMWNLPERCPQASWCRPLPRALDCPFSLSCVLLASQPSQHQKLESALSLIQLLIPWTTSRCIFPELNPCSASAFYNATDRSLSHLGLSFPFPNNN